HLPLIWPLRCPSRHLRQRLPPCLAGRASMSAATPATDGIIRALISVVLLTRALIPGLLHRQWEYIRVVLLVVGKPATIIKLILSFMASRPISRMRTSTAMGRLHQ